MRRERTRAQSAFCRVLLVSLCLVTSAWCAYRSARAELSERVLDWSKLVLDLPAEWVYAAPRTLLLNGARMRITTGRSELPLGALLDRLHASCRQRTRVLDDHLSAREAVSVPRPSRGVLRVQSESEGVVACLELGPEPLDYQGVLARLTRFGDSHDLNTIGAVRMARAERREDGSFFVVASSEGSLPLDQMFPVRGDVPGLDPFDVERPASARRILSVWQENGEPSLSIYESRKSLRVSFDEYLRQLETGGAELLAASPPSLSTRAAFFSRRGHSYVVAGEQRAGGSVIAVSASDRGLGASGLRMSATAPRPPR